jgi:hypothetical protein
MHKWTMSGLQNEDVRLVRLMIPTSSNAHFGTLPTPLWARHYTMARSYFTPDIDYIFYLLLPHGSLPSFAEQVHARLFASFLKHQLQLRAALEADFTSVEHLTLWSAAWIQQKRRIEVNIAERGGLLLPTPAQHSELERCDRALAELDTAEDDRWLPIQAMSTLMGAALERRSIRAFNFLQTPCKPTNQRVPRIRSPVRCSRSSVPVTSAVSFGRCSWLWIHMRRLRFSGPNELDVWWSTVWITLMEWRTKILTYDSACKWLLCASCGKTCCPG